MTTTAHRSRVRGNAEPGAERRGLTRNEALAIVAFWTVFAVLSAGNHLIGVLYPVRRVRLLTAGYEALFWLFDSYLWAAVTPFIFWLAWRFGVERSSRLFGALLLLAAGPVLVLAMMLVRRFGWVTVLRLPPIRAANLSWTLRGTLVNGWFLTDLVTYGGVLAVGFTREYFVRYRDRLQEAARLHAQAAQLQAESARLQAQSAQLQAQLADARLETLRMQLNPHFLFNTLHAVSSLVERDPRGVRRMIARLSELLRYTLQGSNKQEVSVQEEMAFLQKYLDIMQVRFQGRLEIETRVAPEVADALVPTLILQPLVENAVKHGVGNRVEAGRIEISAHRSADRLVLRVRDNGPGLRSREGPAEGEGVGLQNVRARLEQLFGDDQDLTLRSMEEGGALAQIELPLHTGADLRVSEVAPAPVHASHDL